MYMLDKLEARYPDLYSVQNRCFSSLKIKNPQNIFLSNVPKEFFKEIPPVQFLSLQNRNGFGGIDMIYLLFLKDSFSKRSKPFVMSPVPLENCDHVLLHSED